MRTKGRSAKKSSKGYARKFKIPKQRSSYSLWVYYNNWTPKIRKAVGRLRNEGGGCCTFGYTDSSFTVRDPKKGAAIAKKAVRAGAAFAYVTGETADKGYHTSLMVIGRKVSAKAKSDLRKQCKRSGKLCKSQVI